MVAPAAPSDPGVECLPPGAGAARLLDWLDAGLRSGRRGRLRAEFPTALAETCAGRHFVVRRNGRPAAHAFARLVEARVGDRGIPVGTLGLVYTDPVHRRQGLASRCVAAATDWLAGRGAEVAVLWSDRDAFYARLGYHRAGREILAAIDPAVLALARITLGGVDAAGPAEAREFPALEALYDDHPWRVARAPGDLARLAGAPDCSLLVARREGRPVAYAAVGRGDDLPGVVHEWAGDVRGVITCLDGLVRHLGPLHLMAGPEPSELLRLLCACGAERHTGALGLLRVLRPADLLAPALAAEPELRGLDAGGTAAGLALRDGPRAVELDPPETARLLFGPGLPERLHGGLEARRRAALARVLPLPLYFWGFDSI